MLSGHSAAPVIDQSDGLHRLVHALEESPWVAIDTEADSLHAYPEKLCLLQVSVPGEDLLLDPLAGLDFSPLWRALDHRELILHGADYDLRLFWKTAQFKPHRVFDTMCAARILGRREFGLEALVSQLLGVKLEKGARKLNWAVRPLTPRMVDYARNDTRYLRTLEELLRAELSQKGRLGWLEQLCRQMIDDCAQSRVPDPNRVWRIRGSDRLTRRGQAVLRELWQWRETEAIAANRPPYFIFSHERLAALADAVAHEKPVTSFLTRSLPGRALDRLNEAIEASLKLTEQQYPPPLRATGRPMNASERVRFDDLSKTRDQRAKELGIDPTLIASRAALTRLVQEGQEEWEMMLPWQRELLTQ